MRNYYEVLGISQKATRQDVMWAFHRKALVWHPDKQMTITPAFAKEEIQLIYEAKDVLMDPVKRAEYDRKLVLNSKSTNSQEKKQREEAVRKYEERCSGKHHQPNQIPEDDRYILELIKKQGEEFDRLAELVMSKCVMKADGTGSFTVRDIGEILKFIAKSYFHKEMKEILITMFCEDCMPKLDRTHTDLLKTLLKYIVNATMGIKLLAVYAKKLMFCLDSTDYLSLTCAIEDNKFLSLEERRQLTDLVRSNLHYGFNPQAFDVVPAHPLPATSNAPAVEPVKNAAIAPPQAQPIVKIAMNAIELSDIIGSGATASVYQARWNQKVVAVKKFTIGNAAVVAKFTPASLQKECEIMGKLCNPHVVKLYGFATDEKTSSFCLVMEYCEKGALSQYIFSPTVWNIKSSWTWTVDVLTQVSDGLAFLHRNLTLHLDLKPDNILLRADGQVVLCDFGISRMLKEEQTHQTTTHIMGTPAYMDPALFNLDNPQAKTHKCTENDIYSFGMVAASCVLLRRPYDDWDLLRIIFYVANGKREILPENTPPKLAKLITMCWAQDQKSRPTAEQVSKSMQEIHREEIGNNAVTFPTKL